MRVGHDLDLDVARLADEALHGMELHCYRLDRIVRGGSTARLTLPGAPPE